MNEKFLFESANGHKIYKNINTSLVYTKNFKSPNYTKYHRDETYEKEKEHFKNIFKKRYSLVKKFKNSGRVLDVGCSNGTLLEFFVEDGWEAWGIEPSKSYELVDKKIKVIHTKFEDANLKSNFFDVVILNHTLEHVIDPYIVVNKIYKILKKGGIVFIDVPNFGSLSSRILKSKWPFLLTNEHSYHFTKKSLTKILTDADFKQVYSETRSGIFDMEHPFKEVIQSLFSFKKRFFTNLIFAPQSFVTTKIGMGTALTIIAKK